MWLKTVWVLVSLLCLLACSGGGGGSPLPPQPEPLSITAPDRVSSQSFFFSLKGGLSSDQLSAFLDNAECVLFARSSTEVFFKCPVASRSGTQNSAKRTIKLFVNASSTPAITKDIFIILPTKVNDTGASICLDEDEAVISCGDAPGQQDASSGRDVFTDIPRTTVGPASFDWKKIDEQGNDLADSALGYACIKDNVTGLIWEVKNSSFSDQSPNQLRVFSDVPSYVNYLNQKSWCGKSDWRLPALLELYGILNFGAFNKEQPSATDSMLDLVFFNNEAINNFDFWLNEPEAGSIQNGHALDVQIARTAVKINTDAAMTLLVSGSTIPESSTRFVIQENGTEILDKYTNLIWKRCPEKSTLDLTLPGGQCVGEANDRNLNWIQALKTLTNEDLAKGWRLPNSKELVSLLNLTRKSPATYSEFFAFANQPSTYDFGEFWTATPQYSFSLGGWKMRTYVQFNVGLVNFDVDVTGVRQVLLVRDGSLN